MTPAETKGLKIGINYIYTDPDDDSQHTVTFKRDDGTRSPAFDVPEDVYSSGDGWNFICLDYIKEVKTEAAMAAAFSVNVGGGKTVIEFSKELTAAQVAAVFKAAGVE